MRRSAAVHSRVRPHPLSAMQADIPLSISDHRVTTDPNHAAPVFELRRFTAAGTVASHAS